MEDYSLAQQMKWSPHSSVGPYRAPKGCYFAAIRTCKSWQKGGDCCFFSSSKMASVHSSCPQLGDRVQIADCKATVTYVGEVQGQKGTWIGLDWDHAARGKNDGSTGGRSYFQCSKPGSGSFVRLEKFQTQAEPQTAILAAVQARYGEQGLGFDQAKQGVRPTTMPSTRKHIEWQFVGEEKVHARLSELRSLEKATLINCCISCVVYFSVLSNHSACCPAKSSLYLCSKVLDAVSCRAMKQS